MSHVTDVYPYAVKHELENGTVVFTAEFEVGGIDEQGEYLIILEGAAQGEKAYV